MADRNAKRSAFFRGDAGARQTEVELERQKQRAEQRKTAGNMPFRFRVGVGETKQIIICDDKPDFFMYEHALRDQDGKWGRLFSGCVKSFDNCPICDASGKADDKPKESYYAMFLTCIDLSPFSLRDGTEIEFSRKLLVVKPSQQKKFLRFYNKEGTLRGALFDMTRDGAKDSAIGNDIEFVDFVDEAEMATYVRSWKDKEGKKHVEQCDEPFVYEELFEEPTTEALRALVGGDPAPGSRSQTDREFSRSPRRGAAPAKDDDWEADDDDLPFDGDPVGDAPPARPRRGAATPRSRAPTEPADSEARPTGRPTGRGAGRTRETPAPEAPDAADDPVSRRAARVASRRTPGG